MKITIDITKSGDTDLKGLLANVRNVRPATMAAGRGVANELRDHFAKLENSQPNKRGWPRQHFWSDVRGTVQQPKQAGDAAEVAITHLAIQQKIQGGDIRPTGGKRYLTTPAVPEAYGQRARNFPDLKFGFAEDPNNPGTFRPALVRQAQLLFSVSKRKNKQGLRNIKQIGEVFQSDTNPEQNQAVFWLVRQVRQAPTPGALPTTEVLEKAAATGAAEWAAAVIAQANAGNPPNQ